MSSKCSLFIWTTDFYQMCIFFFYHFVAWLFILLTLSLEEHMSLILMRTSLPILSFVNYVIGVKDMV
jgi:hypothetical protein